MSVLVFNETVTQTAPTAGKVKLYASNDGQPVPKWIDDAGNLFVVPPLLIATTTADFTGTNVNTAQPVFNTTEDTLTVVGATSYKFEASYHIHTTGTTSHTIAVLFGGTATFTSIDYQAMATNAATEVLGTPSTIWGTAATALTVSSALASATHHSILLKGIMRINAGGTIIPQYQWSAAPGVAGVTLRNSYIALWPFGSNTAASVGPWA